MTLRFTGRSINMLAHCHKYLLAKQVNIIYHLGYGMLNLNSRIHFHKIKILMLINKEFYSTRALVIY